MNDFVLYGQWVVVVISLLGVALVSSTKHNTRLSGYIVTALGRLSGAILFIFLDLYAFVLVNIIHTIITMIIIILRLLLIVIMVAFFVMLHML